MWTGPAGELLVAPESTRISIKPGVVLFAITVATDQTERQEMVVPVMVGTEERHLGLHLAGQRRVIGHSGLASLWSDALNAYAWETMLTIASTAIEVTAARTGDVLPGSIEAKPGAMFTRGDELVVTNRKQISFAEAAKGGG